MSEKRQQIKKALGRFRIEVEDAGAPYFALDYDALAESEDVIMIECEVEHQRLEHQYKPFYDKDVTHIRGGENGLWHLIYDATLGKPGKYFFIGLPLEEGE